MNIWIKYIALITFLLSIISCEKEDFSGNMMLGTWISTDLVDTLKIIDEKTFKKSYHTFLYQRNPRDITIQYIGPNEILVSPSRHNFTLSNNTIKIDFTNGCYGFESEIITFIKQ
jgi:hypothetical protein